MKSQRNEGESPKGGGAVEKRRSREKGLCGDNGDGLRDRPRSACSYRSWKWEGREKVGEKKRRRREGVGGVVSGGA